MVTDAGVPDDVVYVMTRGLGAPPVTLSAVIPKVSVNVLPVVVVIWLPLRSVTVAPPFADPDGTLSTLPCGVVMIVAEEVSSVNPDESVLVVLLGSMSPAQPPLIFEKPVWL